MITTVEQRLTRIFGEGHVRKSKKQLPDKVLLMNDLTEEKCSHTGFDILDGQEDTPKNWWHVYVDVAGHYHLDR